jgi:hypothetical protein
VIVYTQQIFSGTVGVSGNSRSTSISTRHAKEAVIYLDITAVSGTNPTLDVTLKLYDTLSENWFLLATFSQQSTVTTDLGALGYGLGERMAIDYVVGGTDTPTFTFSVNATFKEHTC